MDQPNQEQNSSIGDVPSARSKSNFMRGRVTRNVRRASSGFNDQVSFDPRLDPKRPMLKPTFTGRFRSFLNRHRLAKRLSLITAGAMLITIALVGVRFYLVTHKVFVHGNTAAALTQNVDPNLLKGEGDGRVNILLMGIGGAGHPGGELADTIMIVSLDPVSHDVTLFSIPRDLYLKIPGFGSAKINAATAYGEQRQAGSGPSVLEATIEQNLGVPIHYFARVDFDAFKEGVDTVGGIDINVPKALYDPYFPNPSLSGYDPLYIPAGEQHMSGSTALKYVRSRETTSDFDRSQRQQLVLLALKSKLLTIGTLANPLKINSLLSTVGDHVLTDLSVSDMLKLYDIAKQVNSNQITRAALTDDPSNYLASEMLAGQSVLVPKSGDFTDIKRYVRSTMPDGYIKRENASITLLNGTDRPGLGQETADILKSYGYNVISVANAPNQNYTHTMIYDHTNGAKPYTIHYLDARFSTTSQKQSENPPTTNITIILGSDYTPVD